MAVVIETTIGDITVDLFTEERPQTCKNFLKLCKIKYYNFCLFHSIQANFIAQTGDPTGIGTGGESAFGIVYGHESRFYEGEKMPKIKHNKPGLLSMVNCGNNMLGSQFFVTLGTDLQSLEEHCVFAEVTEGHDILVKLNDAICDHQHRPYQDIRITHTVILEDPFEDLPGLIIPLQSPDISQIQASNGRIGADEKINDEEGLSEAQLLEVKADREAKARATILEIVGDLPDAEIAPPENVLFVCKLNPVTTDEDLEIIFSRFGKVKSCEVIRDHMTGESLQYAFVEFEDQRACEQAYLKMDNVLIDDRRIHVDFSQSVSKVKWRGKGRGVQYFDKADEKDNSWSNFDRHSGSSNKRDHYRDMERDRDRDSRRGREDERRRRGGGERDNDDHRVSRRNDRRRDNRWPEDDRWEDDRKGRNDRRRDDDRMYGGSRRRDDRRRGGIDDERRRGGDDKKRNGTDRRSGLDKDLSRRGDMFDGKDDRLRESKAVSSSHEHKEGSSKRDNSMRTSTRDRHGSSRKEEEKLANSHAELKSKEEVKQVILVNHVNTTQQVHDRVETLDDSWSNDNNFKENSKEETSKLSSVSATRKKKKRRRDSTSSNSSSSDSSETSSSSSSLDRKKRSKSSLTVAKKYYHKGKLVKIVKKKKNKSSDSETLSDESSDSDKKKKRKKYKKIVKVIKKRRRHTSDDSDSDSSSSEDSDSSRYKKKKRKTDKNNKKKRKDSVKKGKKKKHYDSSESSDSEDEKERRKTKNETNSKKHKVDASVE